MFQRKNEDALIKVPYRTQKRAKRALYHGDPTIWVDQTLYLIGKNTTHHQQGDQLIDEAIASAEALLALLVEWKRMETP